MTDASGVDALGGRIPGMEVPQQPEMSLGNTQVGETVSRGTACYREVLRSMGNTHCGISVHNS